MRAIKFRAWITEAKQMIEHNSIDFNDFLHKTDLLGNINHSYCGDDFALMQFTGLLDKNGKEIYEGDIIKWGMHKGSEEYFHRYAVVEFNPDIQFRILFYVNSETGEKKPTDNYIFHFGKFTYKETDKHIEIIGNVFESPDLVKL